MKCQCIEKAIEEIQKQEPDKYHDLKADKGFNITNSKCNYFFNLLYKKKKSNGDLTDKIYNLSMVMNYCPICGIKDDE